MKEDTNVSVIIIYSFVFLFMVFLFLQQGDFIKQPTGYALFELDGLKNLSTSSLITLIISVIVLIIIVVGCIFVYKKIKNKKQLALE